jgi:hypothetical protein
MKRLWLRKLPSTNPAFGPLHEAERMLCQTADLDFPPLARGHQQAIEDGTWGHALTVMEARAEALRASAADMRELDMRQGGTNAAKVHELELVALGYALGLTAVRVAIRDHDTTGMQVAA